MSESTKTSRRFDAQRVLIAAGAAISSGGRMSGIIDATGAAGGRIRIPKVWTAANVTFVAAGTPGASGISPVRGTPPVDEDFVKVRDSAGVLLKITTIQTAEAGWYEIPPNVMSCGYFRLKSTNTASEVDANQDAEREIWVSLKS